MAHPNAPSSGHLPYRNCKSGHNLWKPTYSLTPWLRKTPTEDHYKGNIDESYKEKIKWKPQKKNIYESCREKLCRNLLQMMRAQLPDTGATCSCRTWLFMPTWTTLRYIHIKTRRDSLIIWGGKKRDRTVRKKSLWPSHNCREHQESLL
jgi:hypothetical protein